MFRIKLIFFMSLVIFLFTGSNELTAQPENEISSIQASSESINSAFSSTQLPSCVPGWSGRLIIGCENTTGWGMEQDIGSSGTVEVTEGIIDNAVQFNWNLGTGNWVQARFTFSDPIDLSHEDIFGVSLHGDENKANRVAVMFRDVDGVFFGFSCDNLSNVNRWIINISLPKKLLSHFFTFGPDPNDNKIDWSRIDRFYLVVGRPGSGQGGGSGKLIVDHVQAARAADWQRQTEFETIEPDQASIEKAVAYILSTQKSSGLFKSWSSGSNAYMYDQGLVLIVMTREGVWGNGMPQNECAMAAKKLVNFLVAHQRSTGNWDSAWDAYSGAVVGAPIGVGGDSYVAMALANYANKVGDTAARKAAEACGDWLANKIEGMGRLVASTENNLDAWWALVAIKRWQDADKIQNFLLNTVWDPDLKYWWRGYSGTPDPFIAADCATWVAEFAKCSRVNRPDMAKAALSFVHRTLITTDASYAYCGLDVMGPVAIGCEATAGYITAGGEGSQALLNTLLALQHANGGLPSSTEERWNCFGWLSKMTGLAPTCWFYFAQTGSPFENLIFPGNMIINGEFSAGEIEWILTVLGAAQATGKTHEDEYVVSINHCGNYLWDINLKQAGLHIENGKTYHVSFDAYAEAPRQISALVGKNSDPWNVYSGDHKFSLTTTKQTFEYSFTMNDPSDAVARLAFDLGLSTDDVYFDNIALIEEKMPTKIGHERAETTRLTTEFMLSQNYPNPFNPETTIRFSLLKDSPVELTIYNVLGQEIRNLVDQNYSAGEHTISWDGRDDSGKIVNSGVYIFRINAGDFSDFRKMTFLK